MSATVNFKKSPNLNYRQGGRSQFMASNEPQHRQKIGLQPTSSIHSYLENDLPTVSQSTSGHWLAPPTTSTIFRHPHSQPAFQLHPECYGQMPPPPLNLSHSAATAHICNYSPVDPATRFYVNGSLTQALDAWPTGTTI